MNKYIHIYFFCTITTLVSGQDCLRQLEISQRAYYNGSLQEVIAKLTPCIENERFSDTELKSALRLLINASLILKEDSLADMYMFQLLTIDPLAESRSSDLAEFRRLHSTYKVKPKRKIGVLGGISFPSFSTLQYRSLSAIADESGVYDARPGFVVGFKIDHYLNNHLFLGTGVFYNRYAYQQSELLLTYLQSFSKERMDYLNIPLQVGYQLRREKFEYYASAGLAVNLLLSSKADLELFGIQSDNPITIVPGIPEKGQGIDLGHQRSGVVFNYLLNVGIRRTFGLTGLELSAQYDFGANNLVDPSGRYSVDEVWEKYSYVANDFKVDALKIMFGVTYRIYQTTKIKTP